MVRTQTGPSVYGAVLPAADLLVFVVEGLVCAKEKPAMPRDNAAITKIFVFIIRAL